MKGRAFKHRVGLVVLSDIHTTTTATAMGRLLDRLTDRFPRFAKLREWSHLGTATSEPD